MLSAPLGPAAGPAAELVGYRSGSATRARSVTATILIVSFGFCALLTKTEVQGNADASRIATVRALVEDRSFEIDRFQTEGSGLVAVDKYFFDGHYYSEKPPLPALAGALVYSATRLVGITFESHPALAYYLITLLTVGLLMAMALACLHRLLVSIMGIGTAWASVVAFTTGGATILLSYAVVFNNHAVCAALLLIGYAFLRSSVVGSGGSGASGASGDAARAGLALSMAVLSDFSCIIFLPFLLAPLVMTALTGTRDRTGLRRAAAVGAVCVPLIAGYLALNVALSGSLRPPATNASLFEYPGSIFNARNLSGVTGSDGIVAIVRYAFSIFVGRRGLYSHAPVLLFALAGCVAVWRQRSSAERIAVLAAVAGSFGFMATFTLRTIDLGGYAYSARWFVETLFLLCLPLAFIDGWLLRSVALRRAFVAITSASVVLALLGTVSPYTDDHVGVALPGGFVARHTAIVNADLLVHGGWWLMLRTGIAMIAAFVIFDRLWRTWRHDTATSVPMTTG